MIVFYQFTTIFQAKSLKRKLSNFVISEKICIHYNTKAYFLVGPRNLMNHLRTVLRHKAISKDFPSRVWGPILNRYSLVLICIGDKFSNSDVLVWFRPSAANKGVAVAHLMWSVEFLFLGRATRAFSITSLVWNSNYR